MTGLLAPSDLGGSLTVGNLFSQLLGFYDVAASMFGSNEVVVTLVQHTDCSVALSKFALLLPAYGG